MVLKEQWSMTDMKEPYRAILLQDKEIITHRQPEKGEERRRHVEFYRTHASFVSQQNKLQCDIFYIARR
jgi:hypothetical protein